MCPTVRYLRPTWVYPILQPLTDALALSYDPEPFPGNNCACDQARGGPAALVRSQTQQPTLTRPRPHSTASTKLPASSWARGTSHFTPETPDAPPAPAPGRPPQGPR